MLWNFSRKASFSCFRFDTLSSIFLCGGCLKAATCPRFELVWLLVSLESLLTGGSNDVFLYFIPPGNSVLSFVIFGGFGVWL